MVYDNYCVFSRFLYYWSAQLFLIRPKNKHQDYLGQVDYSH